MAFCVPPDESLYFYVFLLDEFVLLRLSDEVALRLVDLWYTMLFLARLFVLLDAPEACCRIDESPLI